MIVAVLCWLGLSHGYGMRGVGGVGASVFWGALATAATIFLGLFGHSFSRNDRRASREMTLHLFALCLAPVVQTLFQGLFLQLGFSFEEAFMAGAVVAPPLNLSFSFYYTAYSLRRLRRGSSSRAAEHQISLSSAVPCP